MARGTTLRNIRVSDPLWGLAGLVAARMGDNRSELMVARLEAYTKKHATPEERATIAAQFPDEAV